MSDLSSAFGRRAEVGFRGRQVPLMTVKRRRALLPKIKSPGPDVTRGEPMSIASE